MTGQDFNRSCIEELETANFRERIAVVGSGPSSPLIEPIGGLLTLFQQRCGITIQEGELFWNTSQRAHDCNPSAYFAVLRETFGAAHYATADAYEHILKIGFKSVVTLNYDNQLPTLFLDGSRREELFSVYPASPGCMTAQPADLWGHKQRLVAIHGFCDQNRPDWERHLILRTEDYNYHYSTTRFLYDWWKNLLATHPCVFIGTSLREPGIHRVITDLLKDGNPRIDALDHVHLKDFNRAPEPPFYGKPTKTYGGVIRQIPFDPVDRNFSGLLEILSAFSGVRRGHPTSQMRAPEPITANDKFDFES